MEAKNEQDAISKWHEEVNITDPITLQQQSVIAVKADDIPNHLKCQKCGQRLTGSAGGRITVICQHCGNEK